ncbi:MAG: protein kinase, partial [Myxococcota bacterium]
MGTPRSPGPIRIADYELFTRLGGGGMGDIYLGRQMSPAGYVRPIVLKIIRPHLAKDEQYRRMFLDEARITAMISHPNVVHVLDFGDFEGTYFIAMEYLEGESLAAALTGQRTLGARLSAWLAVHIMAEVCAGLHA